MSSASAKYQIPSIFFRYVLADVSEEDILTSISKTLGKGLVKKVVMGAVKDGQHGKHKTVCVHFHFMEDDHKSQVIYQFTRAIDSGKDYLFYYGTDINPRTGKSYFIKASKYTRNPPPTQKRVVSVPPPTMTKKVVKKKELKPPPPKMSFACLSLGDDDSESEPELKQEQPKKPPERKSWFEMMEEEEDD